MWLYMQYNHENIVGTVLSGTRLWHSWGVCYTERNKENYKSSKASKEKEEVITA